MIDRVNQVRFFEETFFMTNISLKVVFALFFLTLSTADIDLLDWKLSVIM